ncbi:MAG: hypothetical protein EG823_05825 [Actinobacteria bacterium]|nr:hypothetical protein [Actinomycetota bacterium]
MSRRIATAMLTLLLALTVAACDETTSGTDAGTDVSTDVGAPSGDVGGVDPAALLTPADVETVSGLTGLQVVPYDPAVGAGGNVNIATADGQLVAMLVVEGPETWDAWLTDGYTVSEPVTPPVGDEAFIGPNPDTSATIYIFGFRKGDVGVVIDTYFDANGETILSVEQLRQLAEVIESRL